MGIYPSRSSYIPDRDIPDLTGKVILVSGGNAGIGYHTVKELVRHGAKVYMGSRNESRATGAIAQLKAEGVLEGKGQVVYLPLDLSTPAQARAGAEEFMRRENRLDVLVNNAGLMLDPSYLQPVNSEVPVCLLMSTNHIGTFVFTTTLLPLLKKTAEMPNTSVRVVTVSSSNHVRAWKLDWTKADWNWKPQNWMADMRAYGTTKLANILFAKELQHRFDEQGVSAISLSLHPGLVETEKLVGVWNQIPIISWVAVAIVKYVSLSPAEGAYTSLFAATAPVVGQNKEVYGGSYLEPFGRVSEPSKQARDPKAAQDLWATTEDIVSRM